MERRFVKVEKGLGPQGRIAVVRFDRGDNINALSQEAMRELRDVPRDFEDDLLTSVVILTGGAIASGSVPRCARPGRRWTRSPSPPSKATASAAVPRWSCRSISAPAERARISAFP